MHSHIVKDHAGTCPVCGMSLVPRELHLNQGVDVNVSGAMQQAMALTTENVKFSPLWRFINTFGSVQFDETGLTHIHPRAEGWIETLTVNSLGQRVKKGELLYEIYSPELLVAQEDFLSLIESGNKSLTLLERGRQRLRLLGFDNQLIEQLEKTHNVLYRVPYFAQKDGVVSALEAREGIYIKASDRIMTLADLSRVWVIADVFEHQIDWVKVGQNVELDLPALELYGLKSLIEFVYPTLDPITRTLQVRFALDNPQEQLKPDMLATVRIYSGPIETLNISSDALIQTEKHNRVFVQTTNGTFQRRNIKVGIVTQGRAQVIQGLELDEKVVTSGQFLLDAEASLTNIATDTDTPHHSHQH
jgi:Cu(I)/Ag(I) efflux system membrane fusion protein